MLLKHLSVSIPNPESPISPSISAPSPTFLPSIWSAMAMASARIGGRRWRGTRTGSSTAAEWRGGGAAWFPAMFPAQRRDLRAVPGASARPRYPIGPPPSGRRMVCVPLPPSSSSLSWAIWGIQLGFFPAWVLPYGSDLCLNQRRRKEKWGGEEDRV